MLSLMMQLLRGGCLQSNTYIKGCAFFINQAFNPQTNEKLLTANHKKITYESCRLGQHEKLPWNHSHQHSICQLPCCHRNELLLEGHYGMSVTLTNGHSHLVGQISKSNGNKEHCFSTLLYWTFYIKPDTKILHQILLFKIHVTHL